jgi:hypothetical protein
MVRSIRRFVSCVALASVGFMIQPLQASAATSTPVTPFHFATSIVEVYGSQYPLTGRLDLQIFPNGMVRGYYHTSYYKMYIPVTGGRDGDYLWFDIGPSTVDLGLGAGPGGKLHVVATMNKDGSFRGQVYPENAADSSGLAMQYDVTSANPALTGAGAMGAASVGGGDTRKRPSSASAPAAGPTGSTSINTVQGSPDQYIFTASPTANAEANPTP